jgi:hypothetical protein
VTRRLRQAAIPNGIDLVGLVFDGDRRRVEQLCGQGFTHIYVLATGDTLPEAKAALEGMAERLAPWIRKGA